MSAAVSIPQIFTPVRPVQQQVQPLHLPMQRELPLLGRIDQASVVPPSVIAGIKTYRQAVRWCWVNRRAKGMKVVDLGREYGFNRQHAGDYLNEDDKPGRRDLPADRIADFENVCGNCVITQWLASLQKLTVLEEIQAERIAA
jgi:hypothetical protein